jgi:hypothetical protein
MRGDHQLEAEALDKLLSGNLVGHVIVEDRGVVKAREVAVDLIARDRKFR